MNHPSSESSAIIVLEDVTKRFGTRAAVDSLSLSVPGGACFGLFGPNGAGKTTTLRMIYGVTRPTAGSIRVFGIDINAHTRTVRARLGVTMQQNVLIEALTPIQNLRVFGRYHLLDDPELQRRVDELVEFLELGSHANVPVRNLSGGFQRRVAIAMSLINKPELLILDEPTTGLDPAVRLALWARVRELRRRGTTVLLTTHYMDEAERLCDHVAIMDDGKIIGAGRPRDLITRHLARETVEFDCAPNEEAALLDGFKSAHRLRAGNRLHVYVENAAPLVELMHARDRDHQCALVVRPTNLEDVFLALTGTKLEGGA